MSIIITYVIAIINGTVDTFVTSCRNRLFRQFVINLSCFFVYIHYLGIKSIGIALCDFLTLLNELVHQLGISSWLMPCSWTNLKYPETEFHMIWFGFLAFPQKSCPLPPEAYIYNSPSGNGWVSQASSLMRGLTCMMASGNIS